MADFDHSRFDHGSRYELVGVLAQFEILEPAADLHPAVHVAELHSAGLGLLPVTAELAAALTPALVGSAPGLDSPGRRPDAEPAVLYTGLESGFTRLTEGVLALVEALSAAGPVAFLEADYLGRDGCQTAAVWQDGVTVLGPLILGRSEVFVPRQAPISQVLRLLGVPGELHNDEFVVAGLGRYRRTEDWT